MTETPEAAAESTGRPRREPGRHRLIESGPVRLLRWLGSLPALIIIALGVAIVVKTFLLQAFYIPSESMVPTLEVGDRVFVNKLHAQLDELERGDILVFSDPKGLGEPDRGFIGSVVHWLAEGLGLAAPADEDFIKRLIALPGETIEIRDHVVYIDGVALDEPYLTEQARDDMADFGPVEVPEGTLFLMGDNRGNSQDSRFQSGIGYVPTEKVVGEAVIRIWPFARFGSVD